MKRFGNEITDIAAMMITTTDKTVLAIAIARGSLSLLDSLGMGAADARQFLAVLHADMSPEWWRDVCQSASISEDDAAAAWELAKHLKGSMYYMSPQATILADAPPYWGQIITPQYWGVPDAGRLWCLDNGVFSGRFTEGAFLKKLTMLEPYRNTCLFVVAPDVVADAIATMSSYRYWGCRLKEAGWPVAFVAQDGQELFDFPPEFDALFIGGSTEWKMSEAALGCIRRAQESGKWVHVGRVNTQRRIRHFQIAGVNSVDGTSVAFAPDRNFKVLDKQLRMKPLLNL